MFVIGHEERRTKVRSKLILRDAMPLEIERKFTVIGRPWENRQGTYMEQGYLTQNEATVRLRITNEVAWITIKGQAHGLTRPEYEYSIPLEDAREMLDLFCGANRIAKVRYEIEYEGHTWEVDVFEGRNEGLVIAEVEMESEDTEVILPDWVGQEVSHDPRFRNSSLLENPWPFEF